MSWKILTVKQNNSSSFGIVSHGSGSNISILGSLSYPQFSCCCDGFCYQCWQNPDKTLIKCYEYSTETPPADWTLVNALCHKRRDACIVYCSGECYQCWTDDQGEYGCYEYNEDPPDGYRLVDGECYSTLTGISGCFRHCGPCWECWRNPAVPKCSGDDSDYKCIEYGVGTPPPGWVRQSSGCYEDLQDCQCGTGAPECTGEPPRSGDIDYIRCIGQFVGDGYDNSYCLDSGLEIPSGWDLRAGGYTGFYQCELSCGDPCRIWYDVDSIQVDLVASNVHFLGFREKYWATFDHEDTVWMGGQAWRPSWPEFPDPRSEHPTDWEDEISSWINNGGPWIYKWAGLWDDGLEPGEKSKIYHYLGSHNSCECTEYTPPGYGDWTESWNPNAYAVPQFLNASDWRDCYDNERSTPQGYGQGIVWDCSTEGPLKVSARLGAQLSKACAGNFGFFPTTVFNFNRQEASNHFAGLEFSFYGNGRTWEGISGSQLPTQFSRERGGGRGGPLIYVWQDWPDEKGGLGRSMRQRVYTCNLDYTITAVLSNQALNNPLP